MQRFLKNFVHSCYHVHVASNSAALFLSTPNTHNPSFFLFDTTKGDARKVSHEICYDGQICY